MKFNGRFKIAAVVAAAIAVYAGTVFADSGKPTELSANSIEYNTQSGIMTANGNVVMTQEGARISGAHAVYNSKTQEGHITGGVTADKDDLHMTAGEVFTQGTNMLIASGNVAAHKADKTLTGVRLEYNTDTDYALMPNGGTITAADGAISGDKLEAYMKDDHFIASGDVHILSQTRNMEAYSDNADYYSQEDGKIVLTGNAVAMQDNNTIRGNTLTLYMGNNGQAAVK